MNIVSKYVAAPAKRLRDLAFAKRIQELNRERQSFIEDNRVLVKEQGNLAEEKKRLAWEKQRLGIDDGISDNRFGDPDTPLIVGPWLGEVGSELQYWIPFLQRLERDNLLQSRKLIVISRGGTETWYANIADEYMDIFDHQAPEVLAEKMARREGLKQRHQTPEELELIAYIATSMGLTDYNVLHPASMWAEIAPWIWEFIGMNTTAGKLDFRMYPSHSPKYASMVDEMDLPSEFYAVKFYTNDAFPGTPKNLELVQDVVNQLSAVHPIVDLGMPIRVDDHVAIDLQVSNNVYPAGPSLDARTNLGVQTEIIRRSKGLIGTNGGMSYLPAFVGVPSLSFYSEPRTKFSPNLFQHESMTLRLFETLSNQSYSVMSTDDWNHCRRMFRI